MNKTLKNTLIVIGCVAFLSLAYQYHKHEELESAKKAVQDRERVTSAMVNKYYLNEDRLIYVQKRDFRSIEVRDVGYCLSHGKEGVVEFDYIKLFNEESLTLHVNGVTFTQITDEDARALRKNDLKTYHRSKLSSTNKWKAFGTKAVSPTYFTCKESIDVFSKPIKRRYNRYELQSALEIVKMDNGSYSLFPAFLIKDGKDFNSFSVPPRVKVDDVYVVMQSQPSLLGQIKISPVTQGNADLIISKLKKQENVVVSGFEFDATGFSDAMQEVMRSNPDITN